MYMSPIAIESKISHSFICLKSILHHHSQGIFFKSHRIQYWALLFLLLFYCFCFLSACSEHHFTIFWLLLMLLTVPFQFNVFSVQFKKKIRFSLCILLATVSLQSSSLQIYFNLSFLKLFGTLDYVDFCLWIFL